VATNVNNVKLKKCNVNGVKCKRINVNGVTVWKSAVTLVNLVGSTAQKIEEAYSDHGYDWGHTRNGSAISTVVGHRYYVRAYAGAYAGGCAHGYTGSFATSTARFVGDIAHTDGGTATGHAIVVANSSSTNLQMFMSRGASDGGSCSAEFYMVVDLTEFEQVTEKTYTADTFWSVIGSTVFYNSKEFEV